MPLIAAILAALAIGLSVPRPAAAEDGDDLEAITLDDLIAAAVRRSPSLAKTRASVAIARGNERAARGRDDWQLRLGATTSRSKTAPVDGEPVQVISSQRHEGTAALVRDLPTGGELELSATASRTDQVHRVLARAMTGMDPDMDPAMDPATEAGASSLTTPEETTSGVSRAGVRVKLRHSLLRGFGRDVARADRAKARLATTAAELRAEGQAATMLGEVAGSFWELAFAAKSLEVRRDSLELARKLQKEAKAAVREGSRPTSDLKVAEYSVAVREEQVLKAELALEEQALRVRQLAGLEIGPEHLGLRPADLPDVGDRELSIAGQVRRGLARNRELKALERDERSSAVDVRVARNGTRPSLELVGGAGYSGSGNNVDEAMTRLGEDGEIDVSLGLQLTMPLGNNAARGRLKAARFERQVRRIEIEEQRREVASQVVLAVHRIRAARKRSEVTAKSIELARANLIAERARFRAGRSSSRELFERQEELDDAQLSRVRAVADYHKSVNALEVLTGDILRRHGVEIIK